MRRIWFFLVALILGSLALAPLACDPVTTVDAIPQKTASVNDGSLRFKSLFADTLITPVVIIGGTRLEAVRGTHGAGTRLGIYGIGKNPAQVELVPGPECCGPSEVAAQVQLFAPRDFSGYARLAISVNRDSEGNDYGVIDLTSSGSRPLMPLVVNVGEGLPSIYITPDGKVKTK